MKTLLILILFNAAIYSQNSDIGWMFINENTIALDKQQHGMAGIALGTISYMVAYGASGENRKTAKIWGIAVPILASTVKELTDINKTGFDWADWGYTVGGGIVATYTFDFIVHRAKKRNKKQQEAIALIDQLHDGWLKQNFQSINN